MKQGGGEEAGTEELPEQAPAARSSRRSTGQQSRSRERIDQLLDAAETLLVAQGFEGLKMRELARAASLPIASIYHYFPSNTAVLRALAEKHLVELRVTIGASLERHLTAELQPHKAPEAVGQIVIDVAAFLRASPSTALIWDALRAVPELRALDIEDSVTNARFISPYIARLNPQMTPEACTDFCLMLIEALQSNLMVIMHASPERQPALIRSLAGFSIATIRGFQQAKPGDAFQSD